MTTGSAAPGPVADPGASAVLWCDRCGESASAGDHRACAAARELEPPRFCAHCRRRMKVQVVPTGWTATCVEHGVRHG